MVKVEPIHGVGHNSAISSQRRQAGVVWEVGINVSPEVGGQEEEDCPPRSTEHLWEGRAGGGRRATGTGEREEAAPPPPPQLTISPPPPPPHPQVCAGSLPAPGLDAPPLLLSHPQHSHRHTGSDLNPQGEGFSGLQVR